MRRLGACSGARAWILAVAIIGMSHGCNDDGSPAADLGVDMSAPDLTLPCVPETRAAVFADGEAA
jgi:hypothetical protein